MSAGIENAGRGQRAASLGTDTTSIMTTLSARARRGPRLAWLRGLIPLLVLLLAWQLLGGDPLRFPPPSRWFEAIASLNAAGVLLPALGQSLFTFLVGLAIAVIVGSAVGLVVGALPRANRALSPLFDFLRGLPVPVLVPVTMLMLGVGLGSNIFVVAFAATWPILFNTALARRSIASVRMDTSAVLRLGPVDRLVKIVVPSVFPSAMVGIRIAASLGVITTLVVEMIGGSSGAGFLLAERQARFDSPGMWGVLFIIGVFGFLMNLGLELLERRVLRNWPGAVGEA